MQAKRKSKSHTQPKQSAAKTDSEIEQWVLRELSLRLQLRSRELCVFARDGVVIVMGSALSYEDKVAIEESVRSANGVVGVVNEIKVKPRTTHFIKAANLAEGKLERTTRPELSLGV